MYSEQPEDDARQKATELQAEYPQAVVGVVSSQKVGGRVY